MAYEPPLPKDQPVCFDRMEPEKTLRPWFEKRSRKTNQGGNQRQSPAYVKAYPRPEPEVEKSPEAERKTSGIREGPRVVAPNEAGIGRMVPNISLKPLNGKDVQLKNLVGKSGLAVVFTNTTCPICQKYGPTLAKLEEKLAIRGIEMLFVNPTGNDKTEDMAAFRADHKLKGPYIHDRDGIIAKTFGTKSTAEVFLLDQQRTVVYRGAIDDQYGLGYTHDSPKRTFLFDAVTALFNQRNADPAATTAPGCELDLTDKKTDYTHITYHNRISRIIQRNCIECHRNGGVAPFSLEKHEDVVAHAGMIHKVVEKGTMPPWFASPPGDGKPTQWANDRSINSADKAELLAWLKSNRPQGDPADAPIARTYADGWLIGKPDAVFKFPKAVEVRASGIMPYQNILVETNLPEDKWVKAVEIRPSNREVVHHVLVFTLPPGNEDPETTIETAGDERKGFFAIYVPGQSVLSYPDGFGKRLRKGSRLRFQVHYTPNGKATEDKTQIGLVFAERVPEYEVKVAGIVNAGFRIPPGAPNHPVEASLRTPVNANVLGFLPHMHLRGKSFRYEITPSDGKTETVLEIPHYDFNWQLYYRLAQPITLPKGSVVKATGWFDNSEMNPANPDPKKTVRWGPQTTDEMMLGYVEYYVEVGSNVLLPAGLLGNRPATTTLFKRADSDGNNRISRTEYDAFVDSLPRFKDKHLEAKRLFEWLDSDKDETLTKGEFEKLARR